MPDFATLWPSLADSASVDSGSAWPSLAFTDDEAERVRQKEQRAADLKKRIDTEPWAVANDKTLPPGDRFLGAIAFQDKLAKDSDYNPDPLYFPKKFWVVGGGLSAAETLDAKRSRDRIAKGTADDMDYWRAARYMKMLESQKNYTDAQWYADGILEIGSFVGDMLATGGVSGAAGSAAKKGATKLATKSFGAAVGKQVGTAAGMGAFTATATALNPGRVAESAATRYADQGKDPATAIAGGVGDVATEMFTEQLGGAAMKFLPKALRKKLWVNPRGLWGRSNIQGFPLEMGEETAGDVIRGVTGLSEDYGATGQALQGNLKPLAGTAALVALPGGIQAGTALAGRSQTPLRFDTTQKLPTAAEVNEAMSRPETAQAWATANPEAAARMAAIDSPSRKEWEELTGEKMRGNSASRKAFADNVREAIRQPGMTTDRQMSGGFSAENAGSGEVARQPTDNPDNRRDPRWHYGKTPWKPEPSPESIADTVGTTPIANDPTPGTRQSDVLPVEQPVEQVTEFSTPKVDYSLKGAPKADTAVLAPETPPTASEPAPASLLPPDLQNATDDELAGILKSLGGKPPAKFPKNTYRSRLESEVAGLFKQPPGKVTFPPNKPEQRAPVATVTPESANALNQPVSDKTPQPAPRNPAQEAVADTGEIIAESLDVPLRKGPSMTQSPAAAGIASGGVSINLGGIGSWVKKWFATGGHAPKSVFNRREQYTADIAADEKAIRNKANDLKDSLRAEYGSSKLPSLDAKRTVNAALQGDAQAMASFKPRTQAAIKALREHIDQFSRRLIATGVTKGSLTLTVEENMGTYVTRSYQAHDDANWMPSEKVRLDAFNHLQDIFPSESAHQINNRLNDILQKAKGGAPVDVIRSSTTSVKEQGILKARKDIAPEIRAFLGEYNDPFINYAKSATKMAHLIASQEFLKDIRETGLGKFFFEKNDPNRPEGHNTLIAEPVERPGPSPVRLFGHVHSPSDEVKNVRPRAGMTPGELRKALVADAAAKVESEKASAASAAGVAEYNRGAIMDRARAEVEADRQQLLAPLAGLYTTPEIFEALQDMNSPQQVGWFMRQLLRGIYATKLGKVVLSPQALVRNFISNPVFALQNGYLFGRSELGKAGSATLGELQASLPEAVRARWKTDQGRRDAAERYARLRVTGDGVHEGELRDAMAEVTDATKQAVEAGPFGLAVKGIHASVDAAKTLYRLGDDFWKIFAFESERARYKSAYEKAGRTISDVELDTLAADIVRDTWPTYSRQAKAVTLLRRNPLIAPFPSFPAEVLRTTIKSVQLSIKEMNDPATREIGAKRFAGNMAVMILPVAAAAAVRAMLDIDDEDDEALRKFIPDWQKNADIIWLSKPENGKAKYIDLSYTVPHSQWREPFRSTIRGESATQIAQTASEPFIGEELLMGKLLDLARNKTAESGREVYPEYGTTGEKFKASVKHVAEGIEPGFMTSAKRIGKGLTGYVEPSGRSYNTLEEVAAVGTGFRIQSADAAQALSFHARNYAKAKPKTTGMFSGTLGSRGTTTNEQIAQAYQSSDQARQGEFKKMRDSAQAALRLGVSEEEVRSILKANGVSATNHDDPNSKDPNVKLPSEIDRVLKGDYEPYRLSRDLYDHVQSLPDGQQRLEAYQAASGDDESIAELHRIDVTNRADVLARDYKDVPFAKRPAWRQEKAEALQWLKDKGLTKDDVLKIYSPKFRSLKDAKERGKKHDRLSDALGGL